MLVISVIRFFCTKRVLQLLDYSYARVQGNWLYVGPYAGRVSDPTELWSKGSLIKLNWAERIYIRKLIDEILCDTNN